TSIYGDDGLGRIFRCTRCRTRLPADSTRGEPGWTSSSTPKAPSRDPTPRVVATREVAPASLIVPEQEVPAPVQTTLVGWPARVGRFEIRSKVGSGSFSTVYRAFD